MIHVEATTTIDRPTEDVAAYIADIERMTEWTDMTASRRLTEGPTRDGTRAYAEVAFGPFRLGWTYQITDFDAMRGFAYRTVSGGPLSMDGRIALTSAGTERTRVDYRVDVRTGGLLRLLEPFIRSEIATGEAREVERLKERVEAIGSAVRP